MEHRVSSWTCTLKLLELEVVLVAASPPRPLRSQVDFLRASRKPTLLHGPTKLSEAKFLGSHADPALHIPVAHVTPVHYL